jgi:hypothetical protein
MHKKGENRNNMVESRDMEIKRDQERFRKRKVPPMLGEEDVKHILLKYKESKKWREEWANSNCRI